MLEFLRHLHWSQRVLVLYGLAAVVWFALVAAAAGTLDLRSALVLQLAGGVLAVVATLWTSRRFLALDALRRANADLEDRCDRHTEALRQAMAEQARAMEAWRDSEARLRDIVQSGSDWVWEMDAALLFRHLSSGFAEATGMAPRQGLGRGLGEIFAGAAENALASVADCLKSRRPFRDLRLGLGGPVGCHWIALSGRPVHDAAGRFAGFRGTGRDVTAATEARLSAERLQHRHELILAALGEGVFGIAADGRLTFINTAAEERLGWSAAEAIGRPAHEMVLPLRADGRSYGAEDCPLYACLRQPGAARVAGESFRRRDGSTVAVEFVGAPLSEAGQVVGAVIVFRDVSEEQRTHRDLVAAKEAAERATAAKSDFLAMISHEVRTPLNAIVGFSDLIVRELFGPIHNPRYREYLDNIRDSAEHLLDLIGDLVDLTRIEAGELTLQEHTVDIAELAAAAGMMLRTEAERTGCRLVADVPANLPRLLADPRRLRQVLINLAASALAHSAPGTQVVISGLIEGDGALVIRVADSGGAADPTAAAPTRGGIGLPLARRLIELHGGTLSFDTAGGTGAVAAIRLPPGRLVTETEAYQ